MSGRPRERILANLEAIYREAYERAKAAGDEIRMADLDASYQREQLLLEVLLDVRDAVQAGGAPAPGDGGGVTRAKTDPIAALETIHRITKLR
jgi:hypothetical protein